MYTDKLNDIVNKYNNAYHRTIKKKLVDVKRSRYIYFEKENSNKGPKFKVGDNVKISKYMFLRKAMFHIDQKKYV